MEGFEESGEMAPMLLSGCGHTYCDSCLRRLHQLNRWRCPDCSQDIKELPDNLVKNFAIVRGITQQKEEQQRQRTTNPPRENKPNKEEKKQNIKHKSPNYLLEVLPIYMKYVGICVFLWILKSIVSTVVPALAILGGVLGVYYTTIRQPARR